LREIATAMTFAQCARSYLAEHKDSWSNLRHRAQWASSLDRANKTFGDLSVGAIDVDVLVKFLGPIWTATPESASTSKSNGERFEPKPSDAVIKFRAYRVGQQTRDKKQADKKDKFFTAPYKSVSVPAALPHDPFCIERGSARGFPSAKISGRRSLSDRRRSNIIPRATAAGRPSPLARRRRCRSIQDKCKASSAPSSSG